MMRTNTHRSTQQFRSLISGGLVLSALWLLAVTSGAVAQRPAAGGKQAVVTVQGMQCPFCAYGIQKQLKKLQGVTKVDVELAKNQAIVSFAPDAKVTDADIQQAIRKAGFTPGKIEWKSGGPAGKEKTSGAQSSESATAAFAIEGTRCLGCEAKITADLEQLSGVSLADVDWQSGTTTVRYDATKVKPEELIRTIERAGKFQAKLQASGR
jgi:mercuric ion binding protein